MADRKIRLVVEIDIDSEACAEHNIEPEEIFDGICMEESEVIDGFEIFARHNDLDVAYDYILGEGYIVSKELI